MSTCSGKVEKQMTDVRTKTTADALHKRIESYISIITTYKGETSVQCMTRVIEYLKRYS